ncbi:MAG: aminotransferase class V-fold PLP-dependent enzyme [Solibacillus sp.]
MYWSKIATTEDEFDQIAALNYATFVEEIPQHAKNENHRLVDKFHAENDYVIVYKDQILVGMLAFRDVRPFSLDQKIGPVENYLTSEECAFLCEIRLLAIHKEHRNGRVFAMLSKALFRHFYDKGYSACVISGTVREEKLYTQMGFRQFADAVGSEEARYLPMVMTRADSEVFRARLQEENRVFYPGPVAVTIHNASTVSHRSAAFITDYTQMQQQLTDMAHANEVIPLVGTGTLANDAMLGQLKEDFVDKSGLILINGEFGRRLFQQARLWGLAVDRYEVIWSAPFVLEELRERLQTGDYAWLAFVHGETSTGTLNELAPILELAREFGVEVCVDCISSFGAVPITLDGVRYATAVSGKSLGAISGLAFVFCAQPPTKSSVPSYLNLALYADKGIPFTVPHLLVDHVNRALVSYPERYAQLAGRMEKIAQSAFAPYLLETNRYSMIATLELPNSAQFYETARLNGFYLHGESDYLTARSWLQISTIQPSFERDFEKLEKLFLVYNG